MASPGDKHREIIEHAIYRNQTAKAETDNWKPVQSEPWIPKKAG